MRNYWLQNCFTRRGVCLLTTSRHKMKMIDDTSRTLPKIEIDSFIKEIGESYFDRHETDFTSIYAKYPRVRICARRAIFTAKRRRESQCHE